MSILMLTEENFDDVVQRSGIVVIDFWAQWCGPCKAFANIMQQVASELSDVTFAKVNIEEQSALAQEFQIQSIPFVMVLRDSVMVYADAGSLTAGALKDLIAQAQSLDAETLKTMMKDA